VLRLKQVRLITFLGSCYHENRAKRYYSGSGCAGNTAAVYTARAGLNPLVVVGHEPGRAALGHDRGRNFPGFPEGIFGPELVENMKKQAERFGAEYSWGTVQKPTFRSARSALISTAHGRGSQP